MSVCLPRQRQILHISVCMRWRSFTLDYIRNALINWYSLTITEMNRDNLTDCDFKLLEITWRFRHHYGCQALVE